MLVNLIVILIWGRRKRVIYLKLEILQKKQNIQFRNRVQNINLLIQPKHLKVQIQILILIKMLSKQSRLKNNLYLQIKSQRKLLNNT